MAGIFFKSKNSRTKTHAKSTVSKADTATVGKGAFSYQRISQKLAAAPQYTIKTKDATISP